MAAARYPVPDEAQCEMLRRNGIDPAKVCVVSITEDGAIFKNYKTGDTIRIEENFEKKNRREMGW